MSSRKRPDRIVSKKPVNKKEYVYVVMLEEDDALTISIHRTREGAAKMAAKYKSTTLQLMQLKE